MKKKYVKSLLLIASLVCLAACGKQQASQSQSSSASSTTTSTSTSATSSSSSQSTDITDTQRIGTEEVGYVDVPADWVVFIDASGKGTYQYSAKDGISIVTMDSYTKDELGIEKIDATSAETVATNYAYGMDQSGQFGELTGAKTTIGDYAAYQVYGTSKAEGKLLCAWIFTTEELDRVYLISLEGDETSAIFSQELLLIESTWSVNP